MTGMISILLNLPRLDLWLRMWSIPEMVLFFKLEYDCLTMLCWFLLYNKMNQLYVYIHPSLLYLLPALHPTPLCHHRALSWAPCVTEQLPASYLFYTWVSMLLSQFHPPSLPPPCPHVSSLCLHLSLFLSWNTFIHTVSLSFKLSWLPRWNEILFFLPHVLRNFLVQVNCLALASRIKMNLWYTRINVKFLPPN